MILIKNKLILGVIFSFLSGVVKAVYKALKIFHVRFLALMALLGVIFYYTGVFSNNLEIKIGYIVVCIIYTLSVIMKWYKKLKAKQKRQSIQIVNHEQPVVEQVQQPIETKAPPTIKYPIYYTVKQNNNYVMAEYSDRFELYKKTSTGLVKVRTDKKE